MVHFPPSNFHTALWRINRFLCFSISNAKGYISFYIAFGIVVQMEISVMEENYLISLKKNRDDLSSYCFFKNNYIFNKTNHPYIHIDL